VKILNDFISTATQMINDLISISYLVEALIGIAIAMAFIGVIWGKIRKKMKT